MGFIAKADGKVDINEINIAKKFMARLGIKNAVERKMAVEAFNFGKSLSFNLDQQLQIVRTMAFANPQILQQFYTIQKEAASIDGHIDPQKQKYYSTFIKGILEHNITSSIILSSNHKFHCLQTTKCVRHRYEFNPRCDSKSI